MINKRDSFYKMPCIALFSPPYKQTKMQKCEPNIFCNFRHPSLDILEFIGPFFVFCQRRCKFLTEKTPQSPG